MIKKYSIGGHITHVEDNDNIENRESCDVSSGNCGNATLLVVCDGCGIQHMIIKNENRICECGYKLKSDNN